MLPRYSIAYLPSANKDLNEIEQYYLDNIEDGDYYGPKMIKEILTHVAQLDIFPEVGSIATTIEGKIIRAIPYKRFIIYFYVDKLSKTVYIVYIIDAHRRYRPF